MFPPTQLTFQSSGAGKVNRQRGELLQDLRHITGNKPYTEEPAVDNGAEMDGMGEVQYCFHHSSLKPQLNARTCTFLCRRCMAEP